MGYQRIKQNIKNYMKTVTVGRRSGNEKLVEDHLDHQKNIYGGSHGVINSKTIKAIM